MRAEPRQGLGSATEPGAPTPLCFVPVDQLTARRFINEHHRHNEAPSRWRFGVGLTNGSDELIGVAVVGNPTARKLAQADPFLCEITRVATTGHKNANSMLYGAACRMAKAGGYRSAITYTLAEESGASLLAAGFVVDEELPAAHPWSQPSRPRYEETLFGPRKRPTGPKIRWRRVLARSESPSGAVAIPKTLVVGDES